MSIFKNYLGSFHSGNGGAIAAFAIMFITIALLFNSSTAALTFLFISAPLLLLFTD